MGPELDQQMLSWGHTSQPRWKEWNLNNCPLSWPALPVPPDFLWRRDGARVSSQTPRRAWDGEHAARGPGAIQGDSQISG